MRINENLRKTFEKMLLFKGCSTGCFGDDMAPSGDVPSFREAPRKVFIPEDAI